MRCPDCNKFVGYEEQDPEDIEIEIGDGTINIGCRIVNVCAECGTELKESTLEMEGDIEKELTEHRETCKKKDQMLNEDEADFNADEAYSERDTKVQGVGRYAKTFYGARVAFKLNCSHCSEEVMEGQLEEFVQASFMDECV